MIVTIDALKYDKDTFEIVDSVNSLPQDEFVYYTETLYKTPNDKYILETKWKLEAEWHKEFIENKTLTAEDLLPQETYKILTYEEVVEWLDTAIWSV